MERHDTRENRHDGEAARKGEKWGERSREEGGILKERGAAPRGPSPARWAAGPESPGLVPCSETRGNRLLIAEVGGKGSGRVSPGQNGSVGSSGRLPRLLRSSSAAGGQPPHPTAVAGRRLGGRGSPERMQQAGGPGQGSEPGGERGPPGPAAATTSLLRIPQPRHPFPFSPPREGFWG